MAVSDSTNNPASILGGQAAPVKPAVQPQTVGNHAMPFSGKTYAASLRSSFAFGSPIGKSMGLENVNKLVEKLKEIYKISDKSFNMSVLTLDSTNAPSSYFSLVLVCATPAGKEGSVPESVSVYPMIIEGSAPPISPLYENQNGQQIEVLRTSGQALDGVLAKMIEEIVRKSISTKNMSILPGMVIPRDFDIEDKTAVYWLALNAGFAVGTDIVSSDSNFIDVSLPTENNDSSLAVTIGFNKTQIHNAVGQPQRSDVLVNFGSVRRKQSNQVVQSVNSDARDIPIAELSGFVDLVWNPTVQQSTMGIPTAMPVMGPGLLPTQKYNARLVITDVANQSVYTPAAVLLSVAMATTLHTDNNWMQAFRPQGTSNEVDLYDIGAMNIEANIFAETDKSGYGTRVDTKKASFSLENLGQYISSIVSPGLMISLDCPEAGPQSWYLSMFSLAERGNRAAYNAIVYAANRLTGGRFQAHFPENTPMFTDLNNIVHLGYWTDRTGTRRDIRDVDTVFVANLVGERSPNLISEWQNTFLRQDIRLDRRLADRKRLIMALTNETAVFEGFARRLTFSAAFMAALTRGATETGFQFTINTPLSSSDMQSNRGVASFANSALLQAGQSFVSSAMGGMPQSMMMGSFNYTGRFGGA